MKKDDAQWFEIRGGEGGFCINEIISMDEYLKELQEELEDEDSTIDETFLSKIPIDKYGSFDEDTFFCNYNRILIRGRIVVPKAVEVVKKLVIEE